MSLLRLPEALVDVVVPEFFSPSRFADVQQCALRVFVDAGRVPGSLPPAQRTLLGIMVHHVREQLLKGRWGAATDPVNALDYVFEKAKTDLDASLESDSRLVALSPLEQSIGRVKWNTLKFELRRWVRHIKRSSTGASPEHLNLETQSNTEKVEFATAFSQLGPEAWLVVPPLRLRGRVDLLEEATDGALEIFEFKSGSVTNDNGEPILRHAKQIWLYALMVSSLFPEKEIRAFIEGPETIPVTWNEQIRVSISEELAEVSSRFPKDEIMSSSILGKPGPWCQGCRLRPLCPSYLSQVPDWWNNNAGFPRPLPMDVWGIVKNIARSETFCIDLIDSAGRIVRVDGISPDRGVEQLMLGDEVYFFDLESTEPLVLHGLRIQPRNFHELPPDGGLVLNIARSLQIYKKT